MVVCSFRVRHGQESLGLPPRDAARVLADAGFVVRAFTALSIAVETTRVPRLFGPTTRSGSSNNSAYFDVTKGIESRWGHHGQWDSHGQPVILHRFRSR